MKKRKRKRKHTKNIKLCIIVSIVTIVSLISIGYGAFSTNVSINVKGNIKDFNAAWQLRKKVVTTLDGLYKDAYEENRYVYRGESPNNWIRFNNELWRIIAVEPDDAIKIIRNEEIGTYAIDNRGSRDNASDGSAGTYCHNSSSGCNAWNQKIGTYKNGTVEGTVLKDSTLKTFLNGEYYESILENSKNLIINHNFFIGTIQFENYQSIIEREKTDIWNGKIGLKTISDLYKASNNPNCIITNNDTCPDDSQRIHENFKCSLNNYLYSNNYSWTITPVLNTKSGEVCINNCGCYGWCSSYMQLSIKPVLFLNPEIKLSNEGSYNNPYEIIS